MWRYHDYRRQNRNSESDRYSTTENDVSSLDSLNELVSGGTEHEIVEDTADLSAHENENWDTHRFEMTKESEMKSVHYVDQHLALYQPAPANNSNIDPSQISSSLRSTKSVSEFLLICCKKTNRYSQLFDWPW